MYGFLIHRMQSAAVCKGAAAWFGKCRIRYGQVRRLFGDSKKWGKVPSTTHGSGNAPLEAASPVVSSAKTFQHPPHTHIRFHKSPPV